MNTYLITGGLGYIGSHICVDLLTNNNNIIIMDNLSNSKISKLDIIKSFNKHNNQIDFYQIDLIQFEDFDKIMSNIIYKQKINGIIHLAGLKAVGESIKIPIKYYENNLVSTINLLKIMEKYSITNLIFSSSSTVYGMSQTPYYELDFINKANTNTGIGITNPYGQSKFLQEQILKDIWIAYPDWNIVLLRYFNPIGQLNLELKEDPNGIPNNLFPYLLKVHKKELEELTIFGSDYNTRDGTCSRDFIHVQDLAQAHTTCAKYINDKSIGLKIYNVGTGKDTTVLELINAFEKINNTKLKYKLGPRRSGDLESSYSNVDLITKELGWVAQYTIEDCVKI